LSACCNSGPVPVSKERSASSVGAAAGVAEAAAEAAPVSGSSVYHVIPCVGALVVEGRWVGKEHTQSRSSLSQCWCWQSYDDQRESTKLCTVVAPKLVPVPTKAVGLRRRRRRPAVPSQGQERPARPVGGGGLGAPVLEVGGARHLLDWCPRASGRGAVLPLPMQK
jgi:hypothetical protein